MLSGYSFRPRVWALAAALAACGAGIALGNWQAGRAAEKRALAEQQERAMRAPAIELTAGTSDAAALASARVAARGRFIDEFTIFLDNKLRGGRPGYEVVTPLKLNGMHVLVNRGWVPAGRSRDRLPRVPAPAEPVRIEGIALARLPQALAAGKGEGTVRQNVEVEAFAAESGLPLHPIIIQQRSDLADGLLREWPRPDMGADKHQSYSLQWYSLAALAVVLFIALSFRRVSSR